MKHLLFAITLSFSLYNFAQETITFPSGDGLVAVTADKYIDASNTEFILLCHQAGYSRGEYIETAPILVEMGYNCMAIDQRSGNTVNGVTNETATAASAAGLSQNFEDAIPDIEAAIEIAYELNDNKPIFLLGSSYSSSLSLLIGRDNTKVKATLAFSPGEYLSGIDVSEEISTYTKPVFVTSSQSEISGVADLVSGIDPIYLTHFQPTVAGLHGSKTLWSTTAGHEQYWEALELFLSENLVGHPNFIETNLSIFPNPSHAIFNINSSDTIEKLEVVSILGQVIQITKNTNRIDLSDKTKGTYLIKIHTGNGVFSRKIVLF